jgi:hypothetical protein
MVNINFTIKMIKSMKTMSEQSVFGSTHQFSLTLIIPLYLKIVRLWQLWEKMMRYERILLVELYLKPSD